MAYWRLTIVFEGRKEEGGGRWRRGKQRARKNDATLFRRDEKKSTKAKSLL